MDRISKIKSTILKHYPAPRLTFDHSLKDLTIVISGATRGIGLAIALRCARDGANIVVLGKTDKPHPKLPGTLSESAAKIRAAGGRALALKCDIRFESQIESVIQKTLETFGKIDILINNASAINLVGTEELKMKRYDLMHSVNTRGTFLLTKHCIPHLKKSPFAHVLALSPPLTFDRKWYEGHVAYSMAKMGMSMLINGWAGEFLEDGISFNALWPRTAIDTVAVRYEIGGDTMCQRSRTVDILSDCVYLILTTKKGEVTGQFFLDETLLMANGVTDFKKYRVDQNCEDEDMAVDFFVEQ